MHFFDSPGMLIGSSVWGFMADVKGRRIALLAAIFIQFVSDALAAAVPSYWVFVIFKVFSGIGCVLIIKSNSSVANCGLAIQPIIL